MALPISMNQQFPLPSPFLKGGNSDSLFEKDGLREIFFAGSNTTAIRHGLLWQDSKETCGF
jgi:hypothetical protein